MSSAAQSLNPQHIETHSPVSTSTGIDPLDTVPWLPCTLSLELPVARFTVGDLLTLAKGSIIETACHQLLIGWTEFEVIGDRLGVRITDEA